MSTRTTTPTTSGLRDVPAVRLAASLVPVVAATAVAGALDLGDPGLVVVVGAVTAVCAARLPLGYAVGLGLVAWAVLTGFAVNRFGQLTLAPADLLRLLALVACAAGPHWRR